VEHNSSNSEKLQNVYILRKFSVAYTAKGACVLEHTFILEFEYKFGKGG